jgi:hypothetical protein
MTHKEMLAFEEAFIDFLQKLRRKKIIQVRFYFVNGVRVHFANSFVGYVTKGGGWFGLHYCSRNNYFYFGTVYPNKPMPNTCYPSQLIKIPQILRDALIAAAQKQSSQTIDLGQAS